MNSSLDAARAIIVFERSLEVDSVVYALWSNCHRYYCVKAKVVRINMKSFTVETIEAKQDCEVGRRVNIPNFSNLKWSTCNRVYTTEI